MTSDPFALRLMRRLDAFTERSGRALAWLNIGMVVLTFAVVVLRYLFSHSSIFLQESVMYLHAAVFMLASAYTLKHNDHVRVDILYQRMTERGRALVDFLGTLLLMLPVVVYIGLSSWGYVVDSWQILETSPETTGIPAVFLLKSLIPLMCLLLLIQGISEAIRNLGVLLGWHHKSTPATGEDTL